MHIPQARFRFYGSPANCLTAARDFLLGRVYRGGGVERLEGEAARFFGSKHALATPQGRVAIYLAVKGVIRSGQKVILSPYTIYDVVNMVLAAGGRPVFADIERQSCNLDPAEVERLIDNDTGAVLVTHLHGLAVNLSPILDLCRKRGVPVIEDAAQALGGNYQGRRLGSLGTVGVLSFGRVKNVNGFLGGMVLTNNDEAAKGMRAELASFPAENRLTLAKRVLQCLLADVIMSAPIFQLVSFWVFRYGCLHGVQNINKLVRTEDSPARRDTLPDLYRARMTPMQARIIAAQFANVDADTRARIVNAERYTEELHEVNEIVLPPRRTDGSHIYLSYPIQVADRWCLVKHLMRKGNDLAVQHLVNTADLECFREFHRDCPVARRVAAETVLLPTYPGFRLFQIRHIAEGIRSWLRNAG